MRLQKKGTTNMLCSTDFRKKKKQLNKEWVFLFVLSDVNSNQNIEQEYVKRVRAKIISKNGMGVLKS